MAERPVSNRLAGLKFMLRAKAKKEAEEKAEEEQKVADSSHWVLPPRGGSGAQCVVIVEGDPKPGAPSGRMSFGSFNPTVEKLMEDAAALQARRAAPSAGRSDAAVSDTEMTERFQSMLSKGDAVSISATKRLAPPPSSSEAHENDRAPKKRRDGSPEDLTGKSHHQEQAGSSHTVGTNVVATGKVVVKVKTESVEEERGRQIEGVPRPGGWRERALGRGSGPKR